RFLPGLLVALFGAAPHRRARIPLAPLRLRARLAPARSPTVAHVLACSSIECPRTHGLLRLSARAVPGPDPPRGTGGPPAGSGKRASGLVCRRGTSISTDSHEPDRPLHPSRPERARAPGRVLPDGSRPYDRTRPRQGGGRRRRGRGGARP